MRAARLGAEALIMHPGPMNRGVDIAGEVAARLLDDAGDGVAREAARIRRVNI